MSALIRNHRNGFAPGLSWVTQLNEPEPNTGIAFGVLRLASGESFCQSMEGETAALLMFGEARFRAGHIDLVADRDSLFDDDPTCVHCSANETLEIFAIRDTEVTLYQTANDRRFNPRVYACEDVDVENRGKDHVGGSCWRIVRTIFGIDGHAGHQRQEGSELVLGEVITLPGRWSSYPPHHHSQPEIYHYRFNKPQGYGHAEHGEDVFKVFQYDTLKIMDGNDHAQVAAPGYGMYYSWVIRHLPDNPYTVPEFTEAHSWTMNPDAETWHPFDENASR